jgi:hypothetical protein
MLVARIKKYGFIHEVIEAPVDETTQEPMALEVYGRLTHVNGLPVGIDWYREWRPNDPASADEVVLGEMTFHLVRATYRTRCPTLPGRSAPHFLERQTDRRHQWRL